MKRISKNRELTKRCPVLPIASPITKGTIWKTIPGCSYYQASDFGEVRRDPSKRMRGWGLSRLPGSVLHECYHDKIDAYLVVRLITDEGLNLVAKIHQIVCQTFHGPRPSLEHCALHKDDDRYNNRYTNLYWGTKYQNAIDRERNQGSGTACLDEAQVRWIKEIYFGDRWSIDELCRLFGVKPHVIRNIITGKSYTWVTNGLVKSHAL